VSTVSGYVAQLRRELTGGVACVTVPQVHPAGEEAEVDFGELWVWLEGTLTKVWLFVLRLSASGKAFHVAFASQAAQAFLEGHVLAFQALGGVPQRIRYDNLRAAVDRILQGPGTGWRTSGSSRCAATTGSIPSSASRVGAARTRRVGWRVRSAGSADATWSPSRSFGR
jgi:transposase